MVYDVAARRVARSLKKRALDLARDAEALEGIEGAAALAEGRISEAARLRQEAEGPKDRARLEDLSVMQEPLVKQTKKGERTYYRWVASWREGGRCRKVYVGSCRMMSQTDALQKAREMKAISRKRTGAKDR